MRAHAKQTRAFATVITIAIALVVLAGCGSTKNAAEPQLGSFAGYTWIGLVKSIHASWTVPRVLSGSPAGVAGSWIGSQAPGPRHPFIQVGTNEQRLSGAHAPEYLSFWSDVRHRFHPAKLFSVRPGDEMSASLTIAKLHWKVAILDATSGRRRTFLTPDEAGSAFNEAQWTAEDVTDGLTGKPFPYPRLTTLTFRKLRVNSAAPRANDMYSSWMSLAGSTLAPSALHDGSFTIRRADVSAVGAQYLRIAKDANLAALQFALQTSRWSARTPHELVAAQISKFAVALSTNASELSKLRLPASARKAMRKLIASIDAKRRRLSAALAAHLTAAAVKRRLAREPNSSSGREIRRALDLPDLTP